MKVRVEFEADDVMLMGARSELLNLAVRLDKSKAFDAAERATSARGRANCLQGPWVVVP